MSSCVAAAQLWRVHAPAGKLEQSVPSEGLQHRGDLLPGVQPAHHVARPWGAQPRPLPSGPPSCGKTFQNQAPGQEGRMSPGPPSRPRPAGPTQEVRFLRNRKNQSPSCVIRGHLSPCKRLLGQRSDHFHAAKTEFSVFPKECVLFINPNLERPRDKSLPGTSRLDESHPLPSVGSRCPDHGDGRSRGHSHSACVSASGRTDLTPSVCRPQQPLQTHRLSGEQGLTINPWLPQGSGPSSRTRLWDDFAASWGRGWEP